MLASILQGILNFFGSVLDYFLSILPNSPFVSVSIVLGQWVKWVNYFIPVGQMITVFTLYLTAVAVWYGVRWILRFSKYIS